jgi:hypothetical protein
MLIVCIITLVLHRSAVDQPTMSVAARDYLTAALDLMQKNALDRDRIDWPTLRRDAFEQAVGAQVPADTYDAIRFAIRSLGDRHSNFSTPGMVNERTLAAQSPSPSGSLLVPGLAHVIAPQFLSFDRETISTYATTLQNVIKDLDQQNPCGWIVDLRQNSGGNMWPMLAGLGPLFDAGPLGSFADRHAHGPAWSYRDGAVWSGSNKITQVSAAPYELRTKQPPIAVLVGPTTASSGEAVAIAFHGNSNTRTFGQPTRGLTTANAPFRLADGAVLNLTQAVDADRSGQLYEDGIRPDEQADEPSPAVPAAAREWLLARPTCRSRLP